MNNINDLIRETTEEAQRGNVTITIVIFAFGIFCLACLIAAGVIMSAKAGM